MQMRQIHWKWLAQAVVLAATLATAVASEAMPSRAFNIVRDFTIASNPAGMWSYGWTSSLGGQFGLYSVSDSSSVMGMITWMEAAPYVAPYISRNMTSSSICSLSYCVPRNDLLFEPGETGGYSVVRWTAPYAGTLTIQGVFEGLDVGRLTGSDVHVLLNSGTSLLSGRISGQQTPLSYELTVTVSGGDTIDFAVGPGLSGAGNFHSTGVRATLILVPFGVGT